MTTCKLIDGKIISISYELYKELLTIRNQKKVEEGAAFFLFCEWLSFCASSKLVFLKYLADFKNN